MADTRIGIIVDRSQIEQATSSARNLYQAINEIKNNKITSLIEKASIDRDIASARQQLNQLKAALQAVKNNNRSGEFIDTKGLEQDIRTVEQRLRDLTAQKNQVRVDVELDNAALRAADSIMDEMTAKAQRLADAISGIGTVFQGLGSVSGAIGSFASGIGDSFTQMSRIFGNASVTDTLTRLLTYNATKAVSGNLSSASSRYDIMSTFVPYMGLAGVDEATANASLQRINDSILGLPIGLDESAQRLRRYQMFLNDVNAATNLTIGLQKAIMAGGANEQMRTTAYYQIDRLLSAGKLSQSRQWLSLIQGLGVSMQFVTEQMGVADMEVGDLANGLSKGEISTQQFLEALMQLGEGTSEAAQRLDSALGIYKGTLESWQSNIQFAMVRGTETVMRSLNSVLEESTGTSLTGYMERYRNFLNDSYKGVANYIASTPDNITGTIEKVENLIDSVSRFSGSDIANNIFDYLGQGIDVLSNALDRIPEGKLEEFIAFATTIAGPLGALFGAVSSGAPVLLGIFERFKDFDFDMLVGDIITQVEKLASVVSGLLGIIPDGMMSDLMAFGLVWGKPLATVLTTIGTGITGVANAIRYMNGAGAANTLGVILKFAQAHPTFTAAAAGLSALATGVGIFFSAVKHGEDVRTQQIREELGIAGITRGSVQPQLDTLTIPTVTSADQAPGAIATIRSNMQVINDIRTEQAKNLQTATKAYIEAYEKYNEVQKAQNGMAHEEWVTSEDINRIEAYKNAYEEAYEIMGEARQNLYATNDAYNEHQSALDAIIGKYGEYSDALGEFTGYTEEILTGTEAMIAAQRELADSYELVRSKAMEAFTEQLSGFEALERAASESGSWLDDMLEGLRSQEELSGAYNESLEYLSNYMAGAGAENSYLGQGLGGLINEIIGSGDLTTAVPQLEELSNYLQSGSIDKVMEMINLLGQQDTSFGITDATNKFGEDVERVMGFSDALSGALETAAGAMQENNEVIDETLSETGEIIESHQAPIEDASAGVSQSAADGLNSGVPAVQSASDNVVSPIEELPPQVNSLQGPMNSAGAGIGAALADGVNGSVGLVSGALANIVATVQSYASQIAAAAAAAASAAASAASINYSASNGSSYGGAVATPYATGGTVFRMIGTDIVPAVLTPGEYVVRRGATDFFGTEFFNRINSLDVEGAFNRLMSIPQSRHYVSNNYSRDNHATVNQNIITNNPNYANRRAWRFANAL